MNLPGHTELFSNRLRIKGPFTLQTELNAHSNQFASMRIRTGSIRFRVFTLLQTHKCKVVFVTWQLRQHRMTITARTMPVKMEIISKIIRFRVTPLSWLWTFTWPHTLTKALVCSFVQPAVFTSLNLRVHTWALIDLSSYRTKNNVYIAWLQVRIHHFAPLRTGSKPPPEVDWKQTGLNPAWTDPLLVWTRRMCIELDWMCIECAVWTGL